MSYQNHPYSAQLNNQYSRVDNYIGRELMTEDHMFSNECSGRYYCYKYMCHAYKIVADIQN